MASLPSISAKDSMLWPSNTGSRSASRGSSAVPALASSSAWARIDERDASGRRGIRAARCREPSGSAASARDFPEPPAETPRPSPRRREWGRGLSGRRAYRRAPVPVRADVRAATAPTRVRLGCERPCTTPAFQRRPPLPPPPCSVRVADSRQARPWRRPTAVRAAVHGAGAARTCAAAGIGSRRQYYATWTAVAGRGVAVLGGVTHRRRAADLQSGRRSLIAR
jgi:hypothetical protein